jgi:hypothetical protein
MARKQKHAAGSGQQRKETKEERKERIRQQEEAREKCFKVLPYVGGFIVLLMILFAIYVNVYVGKRTTISKKVPDIKLSKMSSIAEDGHEQQREGEPIKFNVQLGEDGTIAEITEMKAGEEETEKPVEVEGGDVATEATADETATTESADLQGDEL